MTFVAAAIGAGLGYGVAGTLTGAAIGAGSEVMALSIATGVIKAILVENGQPVEYGHPLMVIG